MPARSKYRCVDPRNPEAAGVCDRGGEVRRRSELMPQMRWAGDRQVSTGWLVCRQHMDEPNPQDRPLRLRPDPAPVRDPRPMPTLVFLPSFGTRLSIDFVLGSSALGTRIETGDTLDFNLVLDVNGLD